MYCGTNLLCHKPLANVEECSNLKFREWWQEILVMRTWAEFNNASTQRRRHESSLWNRIIRERTAYSSRPNGCERNLHGASWQWGELHRTCSQVESCITCYSKGTYMSHVTEGIRDDSSFAGNTNHCIHRITMKGTLSFARSSRMELVLFFTAI